jgi:putative transposase
LIVRLLKKGGLSAEADDHRQAAILRCCKTPDHANPRAPFPQRIKQSCGELASAAAKTGAGDASISITVALNFSAARNLFVTPRTGRTAPAIHLHRTSALAHRKSVTGVAA